jgi:outer membrane protein assembly factor BamB
MAGTAVAPASDGTYLATMLATHDLILVGTDGAILWRTHLDVTPATLAVSGDRVYFTSDRGMLCAVRVDDGRIDWCFDVRVPAVGAPAVSDTLVFVALRDNTLRSFDRHSGAMRGNVQLGARPISGPRLAGSTVIVPLLTADLFLLSADRTAPDRTKTDRVTPPAQQNSPTMQAFDASADGRAMVAILTSPSGRVLVGYRKRE